MTEHGICAKCKRSVGCRMADIHISGCSRFEQDELPLTNEEWLRSCSTEELADFLFEHGDCIGCPAYREVCARRYDDCKTAFLEWLKETHTE